MKATYVQNLLAIVLAFTSMNLLTGTATAQVELSPTDGLNTVHILPSVDNAGSIGGVGGPLLYHGGPVMARGVLTYAIFWLPASGKLQNNASTTLPAHYQAVQELMLAGYPGHGIGNNNTQYYQTVGGVTSYIQNFGALAGAVLDTDSYPASGCADTVTPGNCITDSQIQAEIKKVLTANGWTGGLDHMFFLFTSSGEGSCFNSASTSCAYTQYCAYHGSFSISGTPVIYGNEPFGDVTHCQVAGTPSPNGDPSADAATTALSHELTEAITDPLLNAWFTSNGEEIGDLCNFNFGPNTWDSRRANQMWNGNFFELQQEFDNHSQHCVQVGPSHDE